MRDKLIELIKSRRDPCDIGACPFTADDVRPCSLCETESLAEHLIANGVTFADVPDTNVGKWIPVSERLPENEVRVLVMLKAGTSNYTNMDTDRTYKSGVWVRWGKDVTHWMPLPEPPKEGE